VGPRLKMFRQTHIASVYEENKEVAFWSWHNWNNSSVRLSASLSCLITTLQTLHARRQNWDSWLASEATARVQTILS
jgi:hypothetical protein